MKVSLVIAVFESYKVVARQLRHFKRITYYPDVEYILVDDGSDPPLHHENCGLQNLKILFTNDKRPWTQGLARNMGAREAKGEFLLFTDIDHIIPGSVIEAVRNFDGDKMVFERKFGILDVRGHIVSDLQSMLAFGLNPIRVKGRRGFSAGVHGNTYAIRKSIFEQMGGYNPVYCNDLPGGGGFHQGGKTMSEERNFNNKWDRLERRGKVKPHVMGPNIYFYPTGKWRTDGNNNPFGLFHSLSLEQVPQPLKR